MSKKLVPVALSSEIDEHGREHIHAAVESGTARKAYPPAPVTEWWAVISAVGADPYVDKLYISSDLETWEETTRTAVASDGFGLVGPTTIKKDIALIPGFYAEQERVTDLSSRPINTAIVASSINQGFEQLHVYEDGALIVGVTWGQPIVISTDYGLTWHSYHTPFYEDFEDAVDAVRLSSGRWIVWNGYNEIYYTDNTLPDGNWVGPVSMPTTVGYADNMLAVGNTAFIPGVRRVWNGSAYITSFAMAITTDAQTWNEVFVEMDINHSDPQGIAYGDGTLVVGVSDPYAVFVVSDDMGQTWQKIDPELGAPRPWKVVYGDGVFVAYNNSVSPALLSRDKGRTWEEVTGLPDTHIPDTSLSGSIRIGPVLKSV